MKPLLHRKKTFSLLKDSGDRTPKVVLRGQELNNNTYRINQFRNTTSGTEKKIRSADGGTGTDMQYRQRNRNIHAIQTEDPEQTCNTDRGSGTDMQYR
jgi:hypothetical protein